MVAPCSQNVVIGGASAQDPRVAIQPEVPEWAVTGLQMLGVAGAILALPYSVAALGIGGTVAAGVLGAAGSLVGGKAMRALGESMGLSEGWVRAMEAGGELGGGMLGGAAGARRFGTPTTPMTPLRQKYLSGSGGRWGSRSTRAQNDKIASSYEEKGYRISGGAGRASEEWIPGAGGSTKGGSFVDITATKGGKTVRIQTVTTKADGITPTVSEAAAANRIRAAFPNDDLILIPKGT